MGYQIVLLNPWRKSAKNQAFTSLRIAAERLGHLLVHCNSIEIEECDPDFVLATASNPGKTNPCGISCAMQVRRFGESQPRQSL
jgi:hypothetical protein